MIEIETNFKDYFVMTDKDDNCVEFLNGYLYSRLEGDDEPVKSRIPFKFKRAWKAGKHLLDVDI
jgi:hypothetical protein